MPDTAAPQQPDAPQQPAAPQQPDAPQQPVQTPSQTVGPFYGYALRYEGGPNLVPGHHPEAIRLHGTVYDGEGTPVPDALVEIWQADAAGRIPHEQGSLERDGYTFTGFGRAVVNLAGHFMFTTVKPGAVGSGAPYVLLTVFARGLMHHLFTRAYFPEDAVAQETDAVLAAVPAERRATLVAVADGQRSYRFDIRLQGEGETVFLDFDA
ncbi:MAG: protocatechuate 3,4-dioxygenase subunit alpha [Microbacteriaceae bacterium]|nr:MAG: protocatechuate 3,4-dioxygenase subunit alpha [Microbacteriaceae bacterium]